MSVNRLGRYREKLTLDPTRGRRTCTELEAVTAVALFSGMGMWRGEGRLSVRDLRRPNTTARDPDIKNNSNIKTYQLHVLGFCSS